MVSYYACPGEKKDRRASPRLSDIGDPIFTRKKKTFERSDFGLGDTAFWPLGMEAEERSSWGATNGVPIVRCSHLFTGDMSPPPSASGQAAWHIEACRCVHHERRPSRTDNAQVYSIHPQNRGTPSIVRRLGVIGPFRAFWRRLRTPLL